MQNTTQAARTASGFTHNTGLSFAGSTAVDPAVFDSLDLNLFKSLLKIGHPRERICSALDLSYAEYDCILESLEAPVSRVG